LPIQVSSGGTYFFDRNSGSAAIRRAHPASCSTSIPTAAASQKAWNARSRSVNFSTRRRHGRLQFPEQGRKVARAR
jgi:hypothetical protein